MILPSDITYNDIFNKKMKKVFCSECKNYGCFSSVYCRAGLIYNTPTHYDDTPFRRAYDDRNYFFAKEMEELNKNNNCKYYEKNIQKQ